MPGVTFWKKRNEFWLSKEVQIVVMLGLLELNRG
jgi:hypothetical protein